MFVRYYRLLGVLVDRLDNFRGSVIMLRQDDQSAMRGEICEVFI